MTSPETKLKRANPRRMSTDSSYTHTRPRKSRKEYVIEKIHSCRTRVRKCTRPTACILSYTHTQPRKSRKECVIEKIHSCRMRVRKCTRPAACILSYTYTRPRKSRKECVIQKIHSRGSRERKSTRPTLHTQLHTYWTKQVTQEGSAGELEYEGDSDKHSQEIKH